MRDEPWLDWPVDSEALAESPGAVCHADHVHKGRRPKSTPDLAETWQSSLVITQAKSWKVKRISQHPGSTLAVCDMRGNPKSGRHRSEATVLDVHRTGAVYDAIGNEYA